MENLRQVVLGVSFFKKDVRGKSFVIAFNDLDEVHAYVPTQFVAQAWSGRNVLLQPLIVLAASSLDGDRQTITHELTHVISFNAIPAQPNWFAEGIAGYFETVRLDEDRAMVDVGHPLDGRLRELYGEGPIPVSQLFACDSEACMNDRFYSTAWALFTYLLNEHPTELFQYMTRLIETPAADQTELWASMFPSLPPATLDHELTTWLHHGKVKVLQYNIALRDWPVTERPITEADAWAAKGVLRYLHARDGGTPPEIARALALDPTNLMANMIDAFVKKSVAPELARDLTTAHPDDWRAWWLAWRAAQNGAESRAARERTCTLLAASPVAVPIEACAHDVFAEDPRREVFLSATPQLNACVAKTRVEDLSEVFTVEIDIADSGAVTAARVAMGSPQTNACAENVLKKLTFPPHHSGTFRIGPAGARTTGR